VALGFITMVAQRYSMPRKLPRLLKNFRVKVTSVGVNLFGFNVNFEMKVKKPRKARAIKKGSIVPVPIQPSGTKVVLDTLHDLADKERKRAVRDRDWETALLSALLQGWVQQERRKSGST
jgi:nucleoid DNA-binding protein